MCDVGSGAGIYVVVCSVGNFFQMLKDVELVGADLDFQNPSGFSVYGAPSVVIRELSVAGK